MLPDATMIKKHTFIKVVNHLKLFYFKKVLNNVGIKTGNYYKPESKNSNNTQPYCSRSYTHLEYIYVF